MFIESVNSSFIRCDKIQVYSIHEFDKKFDVFAKIKGSMPIKICSNIDSFDTARRVIRKIIHMQGSNISIIDQKLINTFKYIHKKKAAIYTKKQLDIIDMGSDCSTQSTSPAKRLLDLWNDFPYLQRIQMSMIGESPEEMQQSLENFFEYYEQTKMHSSDIEEPPCELDVSSIDSPTEDSDV